MKTITKIKLWFRGELFMAKFKESVKKQYQKLQAIEDSLVDLRIEKIAQDACSGYMLALEKFKREIHDPEMLKWGPIWCLPCYTFAYRVHDSETAKYGHGKLSINEAVTSRYNELRDDAIRKEKDNG